MSYSGTPCEKPSDVIVEESEDRVVVTVYAETSGMCVLSLTSHTAVAELDEPLGDRDLYDGTCLQAGDAREDTCRRTIGSR